MSEGCQVLLWLSICYSLLTNSLFLAALKISVFPFQKKAFPMKIEMLKAY